MAVSSPHCWTSKTARSGRRILLSAFLLPLLGACSLTTGSIYSGRTVSVAPANPTLGPAQFATVSVPPRAEIIGRSPAYLTSLLGLPSLKRTEAGAELWQYQSPSCVALFYLYDTEGKMAVSHFDARQRSDAFGEVSEELCMKEIVGTFGKNKRS